MTNKELEMIKSIIDKECETGNIDDLKELKILLTNKIREQQGKSVDIDECRDILLLSFVDFVESELTSDEKRNFKTSPLLRAIAENRHIKNIWKAKYFRVYDIIAIKPELLAKTTGVGKDTISILEKLLNKYGLSINQELTDEQLQELDDIREEQTPKQKCRGIV